RQRDGVIRLFRVEEFAQLVRTTQSCVVDLQENLADFQTSRLADGPCGYLLDGDALAVLACGDLHAERCGLPTRGHWPAERNELRLHIQRLAAAGQSQLHRVVDCLRFQHIEK